MDCIFSWNILEITRKDIYFRENNTNLRVD